MSVLVKPKAAITPEEASLAIHSAVVELARTVRGLLDDDKRLEELGRAAAKSNELNAAEIKARGDAIKIIEEANQVVAGHDAREEGLRDLKKQIEDDHENKKLEIHQTADQARKELDARHDELDGKKSTLDGIAVDLREKAEKLSKHETELRDREVELDAREAALVAREAEIGRLKSLISG